ncbi:DUF2167 domain-containing protein [Flavobacterium taihuense]|uniref:DUF2167 domain-containing protein n=1 Tax=Flavobacterium taihuense TaxID=2857508 RepID=A0ABS6XVM1_9FLAO|nr:DUF2167 domain-containing protein [Flavobacterium taihuense]MBW4360730.1 DUF2167 domain-containing protein [Flavobacterium taihuense]
MKKTTLTIISCLLTFIMYSQEEEMHKKIDSIEKTFRYEHGSINLKNGIGKINIPNGFKYLNPVQAERVLVDLWGNPKGENLTLGLLLPENQGVMSQNGYVFNIQYDEIGHVEDDDADDVDYDDLLAEMQKETVEENKERQKGGYDPVTIVGWAAKPFYDKDRKILHWAKEIKFGKSSINTLNYNIRILGRKGVLVLNAIATENELPLVQKDISKVLDIVQFNDGYKYEDFDSNVDEVAAWTIGGLVAGKVLAKVGLFAVIAKFGKLIVLGLLGFFGAFKNKVKGWFSKRKNTENEEEPRELEEPLAQIEETTEIEEPETVDKGL